MDATQAATTRMNAAIGLSALIVVGVLGPWFKVFSISVSGLDTDDGKLVFGLGLVAVVISIVLRVGKLNKTCRVVLVLIGLAVAATSFIDISDIGSGNAGWGIYLDGIAGAGLVIAAAIASKPKGSATEPPAMAPAAAAPAQAAVAASWQADPTGRHELRYWDGAAWTENVSDAGVASSNPL
jgi:hypothetical protein